MNEQTLFTSKKEHLILREILIYNGYELHDVYPARTIHTIYEYLREDEKITVYVLETEKDKRDQYLESVIKNDNK